MTQFGDSDTRLKGDITAHRGYEGFRVIKRIVIAFVGAIDEFLIAVKEDDAVSIRIENQNV